MKYYPPPTTRGWMSNFSLIFSQFLRFFSYIQYTLGSFPIGIFKNLQFFIINDMQESLNLLTFCIFWVILTQKSCFFTSFWYMWNTLEKVFISKMKNVWFWLENESKWNQWLRNYSYVFFLFRNKWSHGIRVNVKRFSE